MQVIVEIIIGVIYGVDLILIPLVVWVIRLLFLDVFPEAFEQFLLGYEYPFLVEHCQSCI